MIPAGVPDSAPRRYSAGPLPENRYVPGDSSTSRPDLIPRPGSSQDRLNPGRWAESAAYLYGIDLYNYAYWWEAHEVFEGLWKPLVRESAPALYLQGLIQISAAFLKWRVKNRRGLEALYESGIGHLRRAGEAQARCLGVQVSEYVRRLDGCFSRLAQAGSGWPDPLEGYPVIVLER